MKNRFTTEFLASPAQRAALGHESTASERIRGLYDRLVSLATATCVEPATNADLPRNIDMNWPHTMSGWKNLAGDSTSQSTIQARIHLAQGSIGSYPRTWVMAETKLVQFKNSLESPAQAVLAFMGYDEGVDRVDASMGPHGNFNLRTYPEHLPIADDIVERLETTFVKKAPVSIH